MTVGALIEELMNIEPSKLVYGERFEINTVDEEDGKVELY